MNPALRDILESTSFSPTDISGLVFWFDAADTSSITLDGSNNVSQWNDKSGNSRHLTQATTLLRPAYGTQTQNGYSLVVTDAAGQTRMQTGNVLNTAFYGTARQTGTLFRVVRNITGTINGGFHDQSSAFTDTMIWRPTQILQFRHGSFNDDANGAYGGTLPTGGMDILVHEIDLSVPTVRVRRNRSLFATLTPGSTTPFTSGGSSYYRINWDAAATTAYHAEHVFYNRILTSGEIAQVETYLAAKWGL